MIPQTDVRYNYQYAQRLYKGARPFDEAWMDILKYGSDFERVFDAIRDRVFAATPAVTGYAWGENVFPYIPVYLVESDESLPDPLTLVVREDIARMIVDLVTLLVYQNIHYGFKTPELRQGAVQKIAGAVLQKLGIDARDALQDMHTFYVERYGESYRLPDWDLAQQTAKTYLERHG